MAKERRENSRNYFMVAPEKLIIQSDPKGKFYDQRVELPLIESTVLNIMAIGVQETILAVSTEDGDFVVSGRQRTKHAIEANKRLVAQGSEPLLVPVKFARNGETMPLIEVSLNEHRQDDSPLVRIEKAMALRDRYSDEQIASTFRISVAHLKNWFAADSLSPKVKKLIEKGAISVTAASKFANADPAEQIQAVEKLIESGARPTVANAVKATKGEKPEKKGWTRKEFADFADNDAMPKEFRDFVKYAYFGEEDGRVPEFLN